MIGIIGDVHGFYELVVDYSKSAKEAGAVACIQIGDWGMSREAINVAKSKSHYPHLPVYVIAGNHEYFDQWEGFEGVKEVMHNVFFVQKGVILRLDDKNILFFGGASSIDKVYQGDNWDAREDIAASDVFRYQQNLDKLDGHIDIMISHVPPESVIDRNFDRRQKLAFGVGLDWADKSAPIIEKIWNDLKQPMLWCGHMHRKVKDGNCRILDINEMVFYPPYDVAAVFDQKIVEEQKEREAVLDGVRKIRIVGLSGKTYDIPLDKLA